LQDLAEQHRTLRLMMGIGDWEEKVDFDWRRIRDNVCLLRPETLVKINQLIVAAGHKLVPEAIAAVRGDSFVVETNVHYPTESNLIGDGLRKVVRLAAELAAEHGLPGWRQHQHLLDNVKDLVRKISRASRAKGQGADRLKPGYQKLLVLAEDLLERARQLLQDLAFRIDVQGVDVLRAVVGGREGHLLHYVQLTAQVCGTAQRRVLLGETVANEDKLFSIFEPHTELIKRGQQPEPIP
jgi:IS5 family transposase